MKDTLIEIRNSLQGDKSRVDKVRIKSMIWNIRKQKTTMQNKKKKKESKKHSINSLWDNFKMSNICIIGVLEGEEKEQENGNLFEKIIKENFPNLVKEIDIEVQEVQRVPITMYTKRLTPRYIIIKMPKVKEKNLESIKRKEVRYL